MGIEVSSFNCNGCGAPLEIPQNGMRKIHCPYCGLDNYLHASAKNLGILKEEMILGGLQFELNDAGVHRNIVEILAKGEFPPSDVYEKSVVKSVNKYIIPAYWFENVNGMGTAQYEKGIKREYNVTDYNDGEFTTEKRTRTDWFPMSMAATASSDYIVSGNRKFNDVFRKMYDNVHSPDIINLEQLEYPDDCTAIEYDLSDAVVYNETIKELVTETVKAKAQELITDKTTRNFSIDNISIQKGDVQKVTIGIYEIVVEYEGKDYTLYLSHDGNGFTYDDLPDDPNLEAKIEEKKKEIEDAYTTKLKVLLFVLGVLIVLGIFTLSIGLGFFFLIGALIEGLVFYKPEQQKYNETKKKIENEIKELKTGINVIKKNFADKKEALAGVLNGVSGDPEAFPVVELNEAAGK